jgi:flagellar hook-associated protein 1 FlgK
VANFLASLRSSSVALDALQRSVTATQNNVANASTPGYVRQRIALQARDFDPNNGLAGGVAAAGMVSARDKYIETAVRRSVSDHGEAEQTKAQLAWIERAVDLNDAAGIPSALDRLFESFTAWTLTPGDLAAKENVHAAATDLANSFNRTADSILRSAGEAEEQIRTTLSGIETIVERIRVHNADRRTGRDGDAGIDAMLNSDLEELSELINIQTIWQEDGTVTVLAGNQGPLVVGDRSYRLSVSFTQTDPAPVNPDALPPATLTDESGHDLSSVVTGGKLGALLKFRNQTVPQYLGDSQTSGELNRLAETIASRVNDILAAGYPPPGEPYHLFIYGSSAVSVAHSIQVNPALAPGLLNATDPTTIPPTVNGKAQQLADLARPSDPADMIDGLTYMAYFGKISANAGRELNNARQEADSRGLMTAQARNIREQISGVSLDEEAIRLVEFQRAYQASARMVTVLSELTDMAVNLGRV